MLAHLLIAFLIQAVVVSLCRNWWAGGLAAVAWAISREITQAEYRWIEQFGSGLRANMPWWGGLSPEVWHADALLDLILPSLFVAVTAFIADRRPRRSGPAGD